MSAKMTMSSDLATQNEELWGIVEKQRVVIQNLQTSLAIMTDERDTLLERNQDLERKVSPSPGGSSGGPVLPPRSPFRQNAQDILGATIVEPSMPSTYGITSNSVSEASTVYNGAHSNVTHSSRAVVDPVGTALSYTPHAHSNNYNMNNSPYANTPTATERQKYQQPGLAAKNQEESARRARDELKRQEQKQMEEMMTRRQQEVEEQARKTEEIKRMEQIMAIKQQEIEVQARRAEEIKRQQHEDMLLLKQQREYEERRAAEEIKRQMQEEMLLRKQQREYDERRAADEMKRQELRKQEAYYAEQEVRQQHQQQQQQQQRWANSKSDNNNHHYHETSAYAEEKARHHRQQQEADYAGPNDSYTDGSNSPSPTTPKNSDEYNYAPGPMAGVIVEVLKAFIYTNDKGKQVTAFNIAVRKPNDEANLQSPPEELWRVQKLYSDFLALDVNLKSQDPSIDQLLVRLPDRALFSSHSSQKVEQGKRSMQEYLQQALRLPMVDVTVICEFLSSNVIVKSLYSKVSKYRQGYLAKRGKNFGGWKRRYFVLDGPELKYYENVEGQYLGSIHLLEAKIGKQKDSEQQGSRKDQQPSFKHALLVLEPKKSAPGGMARHVLCADSDVDRDEWVDAMSQHIDFEAANRNNGSAAVSNNNSGHKPSKNSEENPEDTRYAQLMQMANGAQDTTDKKNGQHRKGFWPKKIFHNSSHPSNGNGKVPYGQKEIEPIGRKQVFGIPLEDAIRIARVSAEYELPAIVYRCIEFLEAKNAIDEEGIYRLSGSVAKIKILKLGFNEEGDVDLLNAEEPYDIHTVSGLLKLWLRELPENILTDELMKEFLNVMDLVERRERVQELGRLMSMLPLANYTLLRTLSAHLIRVVQNAGVNKMTMRNIGIVFSATLTMPIGIFNLLLTEFNYIFWTNQSQMQQQQQQQQPVSSRNNRNSVNYMYGAPKSIVGLERDGLPTTVREDDDLDDSEEDKNADTKYPHRQHYF